MQRSWSTGLSSHWSGEDSGLHGTWVRCDSGGRKFWEYHACPAAWGSLWSLLWTLAIRSTQKPRRRRGWRTEAWWRMCFDCLIFLSCCHDIGHRLKGPLLYLPCPSRTLPKYRLLHFLLTDDLTGSSDVSKIVWSGARSWCGPWASQNEKLLLKQVWNFNYLKILCNASKLDTFWWV